MRIDEKTETQYTYKIQNISKLLSLSVTSDCRKHLKNEKKERFACVIFVESRIC